MTLKTIDLLRVLSRSFFVQSTWNPERMLSLGFCFCLVPFTRKVFRKPSERADFLTRNRDFFNTHPYMANLVIGAVMKMEEDRLEKGSPDIEKINRVKKRLSESLAVIGDKLFWFQIKSIAAIAGVCVAFFIQTLGPFILLLSYNLPHLLLRITGLLKGYELGFDLVKQRTFSKFKKIADQLNKVGALATGALLILAGDIKNTMLSEVIAFVSAVLLMTVLLRFKINIPLALVILMLISTIASGLLY